MIERSAPSCDLTMPHDDRFFPSKSCPPNCPYRLWVEEIGSLDHEPPLSSIVLAFQRHWRRYPDAWVEMTMVNEPAGRRVPWRALVEATDFEPIFLSAPEDRGWWQAMLSAEMRREGTS